ncbi:MAG: hypothetical protein ACT4QF_21430 [Sporichthyaceae bacterium]
MTGRELVVETAFGIGEATTVADRSMTTVSLVRRNTGSDHVQCRDGRVAFRTVGWYEVLMTVEWDPTVRGGTRFSHTMVSDHEPLHSEAIDADVLISLNGGRQLLRGNSIFGLSCTAQLELGVWQDSGEAIDLRGAQLVVRELCVPWPLAARCP